jgi:hypothetical protein
MLEGLRNHTIRIWLACAYALVMSAIGLAHQPLAPSAFDQAVVLAAYQLPDNVENVYCLPGAGDHHQSIGHCDACTLTSAPGLGAVAAPEPDLAVALSPVVEVAAQAVLHEQARLQPNSRGPPATVLGA